MRMFRLLLLAGMVLMGSTGVAMAYHYTYDSINAGGVAYVINTDQSSVSFSFDLLDGTASYTVPEGYTPSSSTPYFPPDTPIEQIVFDPPLAKAWVNVIGSGSLRIELDIWGDSNLSATEIYNGSVAGNLNVPIIGDLFSALQINGWGAVTLYSLVADDLNTELVESLTVTSMGVSAQPVPIPSALLLLGSGLVGLVGLKRRKTVG